MRELDACPACGGVLTERVVDAGEASGIRFLDYSKKKYNGAIDSWFHSVGLRIDRCQACSHHWYYRQPDAAMLSAMYASGKRLKNGGAMPSREPTRAMCAEMKRLYNIVGKRAPRLLDYGSGFGRWARAARSAGFVVTAFEPTHARGAETDDVDFEFISDRTRLAARSFDVVNLEQVLEHVADPFGLLCDIRTFAHDDAVIRITVPNILRCTEGKNIWRVWPFDGVQAHTMAPYEHLHGFTPSSLALLAMRANLVPLSGMRMWRFYAAVQLRHIIGTIIPRLGQTMFLGRVTPSRTS
jgi:hypothetical protein